MTDSNVARDREMNTFSGLQEVLAKSVYSWRSRVKELCPFFTESVQSTSQLQPGSFDVSWKATWVPGQLLWLDNLGKAWPGVSVEYYDVLDRFCFPSIAENVVCSVRHS